MGGLVMSLCSSGWSPKPSRAGESACLHRASGEVRRRHDPISLQPASHTFRNVYGWSQGLPGRELVNDVTVASSTSCCLIIPMAGMMLG